MLGRFRGTSVKFSSRSRYRGRVKCADRERKQRKALLRITVMSLTASSAFTYCLTVHNKLSLTGLVNFLDVSELSSASRSLTYIGVPSAPCAMLRQHQNESLWSPLQMLPIILVSLRALLERMLPFSILPID